MSISIYNQGDGLGFVAFQANQVCVTSNRLCLAAYVRGLHGDDFLRERVLGLGG